MLDLVELRVSSGSFFFSFFLFSKNVTFEVQVEVSNDYDRPIYFILSFFSSLNRKLTTFDADDRDNIILLSAKFSDVLLLLSMSPPLFLKIFTFKKFQTSIMFIYLPFNLATLKLPSFSYIFLMVWRLLLGKKKPFVIVFF